MPADEQKLWGVWGQANGIYSSWAASKGVNYYLMLVLYALEGQTAMTQKKICICTGLTKQTVNSVIRTLKEDGSIELAPGCEDRREKQIVLTEKGIAYSGELLASLREMERRALRIMGKDRAQQWWTVLHYIIRCLRKKWRKKFKSILFDLYCAGKGIRVIFFLDI